MQYYGTMLPRIPVLIERKMKVQLLLHEASKEHLERRACSQPKDKTIAMEECHHHLNLLVCLFSFFLVCML